MNAEVFEALSSIDGFSGLDSESTVITRLGGLTNRNYKIDCERGSYVLRLAGEGTGAASANYGNRIVFLRYEALYNFGANID